MPVIIQFWDRGEPPPLLRQRMQGWIDMNPDWHYLRHDRCSAAAFLRRVYDDELAEAFLDIRMPAMMADVFRVAYVFACGGLWIDAATTCKAPLGNWLPIDDRLLLMRRPWEQAPKFCNSFIFSATPRHPFLRAVWARVSQSLLAREGERIWRTYGPKVFIDELFSGCYAEKVVVLEEADLSSCIQSGSSGEVFPHLHWHVREQTESLFISRSYVEPARLS